MDWWKVENPTTVAAVTAGMLAVFNGIISALLALGGVALAQRRQNDRDRKADERKIRDNNRDRLRSVSKNLLEIVWIMYEIIQHYDPNDLARGSKEYREEFWNKVATLTATMEQTRAEVAVDVDDENVAAAAAEMRALINDYEKMTIESIKTGGVDGYDEIRARAKHVHVRVIEAIKIGLKKYERPL